MTQINNNGSHLCYLNVLTNLLTIFAKLGVRQELNLRGLSKAQVKFQKMYNDRMCCTIVEL